MEILAVRQVEHEGLGLLEKIFTREGVLYRYLEAYQTPFPSVDLSKVSALVILGGPMGVYETDQHPFLRKEIDLLREALKLKIPTLGICLGSQLLAAAGGARVYRGPGKEIGWFPIQITTEGRKDRLLKHCISGATVFHWHGDTFDLPKESAHLASSERYPHQAFRMGDSAWGFQFHLEMTEPMIQDWIRVAEEKSKSRKKEFDGKEILNQNFPFLPKLEALAAEVFGEFISFAKIASTR